MCWIQETNLNAKDTQRPKEKMVIFQANGTQKKGGIVISISSKIDSKPKMVPRDKGGHYIYNEEGDNTTQDTIIINI